MSKLRDALEDAGSLLKTVTHTSYTEEGRLLHFNQAFLSNLVKFWEAGNESNTALLYPTVPLTIRLTAAQKLAASIQQRYTTT